MKLLTIFQIFMSHLDCKEYKIKLNTTYCMHTRTEGVRLLINRAIFTRFLQNMYADGVQNIFV